MKSEVGEKCIDEVIALQAKSYSLRIVGDGKLQRLTGVPSGREIVSHEDYRAALDDNYTGREKCVYYSIRNYKGDVITSKTTKTVLSAYDDKRYVISPTKSLAYGHPDIPLP